MRYFRTVSLEADGYFGLGMRPEDAPILKAWRAAAVKTSGGLVRLSQFVPGLVNIADSIFVRASGSH